MLRGAILTTALQRWNQLVAYANGRVVMGMPGCRDTDPELNCEVFTPGEPGRGECDTDGSGFIHTTGLPVEVMRWLVVAWDLYQGAGSEFSLCEAEALRSRGISP